MGGEETVPLRRASEPSRKGASRHSRPDSTTAELDAMSALRRSSAGSGPGDDSLVLARTKSWSSSSTSRGGRRPSAAKTEQLLHSFTVQELPDMLDVGYDADVEVVLPDELDEPDSDADSSSTGMIDVDPPLAAGEPNLTDCLQNLKLQNLMREQRAAHEQRRARPDGKLSKSSHKRGFSESFESDSNHDGTEFGTSEMGSPHELKRSKRRRSDLMSSPRSFSPESIDTKFGSPGQARKIPVWSPMDAMDIDETTIT